MRKKTGKPLDVAAINAAWADLFDQNKTNTIDSLRSEGWISIPEIASKLNKGRSAAKATMQRLGAEHKNFLVSIDGVNRMVGFFRLKA
jgi:predicted transcriptional regulator